MNKGFVCAIVVLLGVGLSVCGETGISVLDIEPGVWALGMGGAAAAFIPGAETLYYNAAGLSGISGINFSSFFASHLGAATYTALDLAFPNVGFAVLMLSSGGIPGYDGEGNLTENLSYGSTAFLLGFGVTPSQLPFLPDFPIDFAFGGRLKGLTVRIAEERGSGFGLDLAFRMDLGGFPLGPIGVSDVAMGITVTNFLSSLRYGEHTESMRMDIRLAAAARAAEMVLVAADVELAGSLHFGVEVQPAEPFAIRAGILTQSGGVSLTLGAGIGLDGIRVDYAFMSHPTLGGSHRLSLSVDFGGIDLTNVGRSLRNLLP